MLVSEARIGGGERSRSGGLMVKTAGEQEVWRGREGEVGGRKVGGGRKRGCNEQLVGGTRRRRGKTYSRVEDWNKHCITSCRRRYN